jgi:hypothetical protein
MSRLADVPLTAESAVPGRKGRPDEFLPAAPHALPRAANKGFCVTYNPTREIEEKTEGIDVTDPTSKKGLVLCARSGFVTINPQVY